MDDAYFVLDYLNGWGKHRNYRLLLYSDKFESLCYDNKSSLLEKLVTMRVEDANYIIQVKEYANDDFYTINLFGLLFKNDRQVDYDPDEICP